MFAKLRPPWFTDRADARPAARGGGWRRVSSLRRALPLLALIGALSPLPAGPATGDVPLTPLYAATRAALLAAGNAAERNGDFDAAQQQYQALAASPDPATAAAGNLALGRLFERWNRPSDAIGPLRAASGFYGNAPDGLRATFLLGEAQLDLKQNQDAAAAFQRYLAGGGPAAGEAGLDLAAALQADQDDADALTALAQPLQATSLTVRRAALRAASRSLEQLGQYAAAAADQQALADSQPPANQHAAALAEAGRLYALANDDADAITALQSAVQNFPGAPAAATALDRLDDLGATLDPVQRALVLFHAGRNDDAHDLYMQVLTASPTGPPAALASYYLGRIADRQDRNDTALADYADAFTLDPGGALAPAALWYRAQLLNSLGRYAEARDVYATLARQFPQDVNAADAAFESGVMAYLAGDAAAAAAIWTPIAQSATGSNAARAGLWLAKLAQQRGDAAALAAAAKQAQTADPTGYFGLRAAMLATGTSVRPAGGPVAAAAPDWAAPEAWLSARFGPENPAPFLAAQATQDWVEGTELDTLGWQTTPGQMFDAVLDSLAQQPWALYRAARAFADRGRTAQALAAATDLLRLAGVRRGGALDAPAALLHLAYPLDYVDLLNTNGAQSGLDPLLIAAVARQESAFDPAAGSTAGAQGLLQLVPSTAQDVADTLGLPSLAPSDLRRPLINLRLGAAYLAQQSRMAGGDFQQMLAGYNAGGGNAARWAQKAGADPDRFYEAIDFGETRLYVRLVSENYAIYQMLYRGTRNP
ncbi:MAG TPA: transglycosylase SLT domain-containing protein [Dehalococcoidia bacterium]|nr:transglycosylase SLT domain-containing protein [Dehalococcoidia bacterium]